MTKRAALAFSPTIQLDRRSRVPLHQQIYSWLRNAILNGQFEPGMRLPSTRLLASELSVSRNTVLTAFDQLIAEGYLEGKLGGGSYVIHALPDDVLPTLSNHRWDVNLSRASNPIVTPTRSVPAPIPMAFRPNLPALAEFPIDQWRKLVTKRWQHPGKLLGYSESIGYQPLREAIAAYLQISRAVRCEPDQVIIVNGSQHALDLAARVLLQPNDVVWNEDPGYPGARNAFTNNHAKLEPAPIDHEGFDLKAALHKNDPAKLIYVTPSCQYPLGVTMSLARRLALLHWAHENDAWILEDDYSSEYRYTGQPLSSLQGLDDQQRVIYTGTFSKVLFPSLRLGYMVVPPALVETFVKMRLHTDIHSPAIDQAVLADFINDGHFVRHIRRMRKLYAQRQALLIDEVQKHLKGLLEIEPVSSGLHSMGWLPSGVDESEAWQRASAHQVITLPLSYCCIEPYARSGLLLGFACVNENEIRRGVKQLAMALESIK